MRAGELLRVCTHEKGYGGGGMHAGKHRHSIKELFRTCAVPLRDGGCGGQRSSRLLMYNALPEIVSGSHLRHSAPPRPRPWPSRPPTVLTRAATAGGAAAPGPWRRRRRPMRRRSQMSRPRSRPAALPWALPGLARTSQSWGAMGFERAGKIRGTAATARMQGRPAAQMMGVREDQQQRRRWDEGSWVRREGRWRG
jgi:hypothetical protein